MRRNRRLAIAGLTAAVITAATTAVVLTAPQASANVAGPYFATSNNASDPHIIRCTSPSNTAITGYCLYTSQDLGSGGYSGNDYPMLTTQLYYSDNGYSNWGYIGAAAQEDWIDKAFGGWVEHGAKHQWAPAAVKSGSDYYVYVPNVSDKTNDAAPNLHTSSLINVWKYSGSIIGTRTDLGVISTTSGYMSDPDVLIDGSNRFLFWADGDGGNCGGLKSAKLSTDMHTLTAGTTQAVSIAGVEVLGNCGGKGRPYIEGSSIYKFGSTGIMPGPFTLIFAAKPTCSGSGCSAVPLECQTAYTGGGANSDYEVIAYATATSAQGPYTYQGIIMCGSTTEWTNQASVIAMNGRWVIVYHDGPFAGTGIDPNRKLHAACLYAGAGQITGVFRAPSNAANSFDACMLGTNAEFRPFGVASPGGNSRKTPLLVSARTSTGNFVEANRFLAGPGERWSWEWLGPFHYVIRSLATNKLLCAPNGSASDELTASCTTVDARSTFAKSCECNGFRLSNDATGRYVRIISTNRLKADVLSESSGFKFTNY